MGSGYPAGWRQWRRLVTDGEYEEFQALNRFAARFRMAAGMRSVSCPGMGPTTAEGYSVALRVALAYTELEGWEKAMGLGKDSDVDNGVLTDDFHGAGCHLLRAHLFADSSWGLLGRVRPVVQSDEVTDVRPLAEAVHNAVFPGAFTPGELA